MDAVKKLTLIAAAVGALGQGVAMAADGTVNFTGSVTASACVVTGGAAGGVITVPMGSVSSKAFTGVGTKAGDRSFSIQLTGCPANSQVWVRFAGASDPANIALLKLTAGGASGVAIGIAQSDGTPIAMATDPVQKATTAADGSVTLSYRAYYQATAASVTTGLANASSDFTVIYN